MATITVEGGQLKIVNGVYIDTIPLDDVIMESTGVDSILFKQCTAPIVELERSIITIPSSTSVEDLIDQIGALTESANGDLNGFADYNDTTGAISLPADTWTDIPNDGLGAFTNKSYLPTGVTELMDTSTGYIDTSELSLGDTILIRNDYTINPNTNNALLKFRYSLGTGAGSYTLEKIVGRLDSGSGQDYRFSLEPDLIYMGDDNTRLNPIKLQVFCSSNATLTNAGSAISVIKR